MKSTILYALNMRQMKSPHERRGVYQVYQRENDFPVHNLEK